MKQYNPYTDDMTDEQMVEYLRTQAHWTSLRPWAQIADRLEQLSKKEKENG